MDGRRTVVMLALLPMAAAAFAKWQPAEPSAVSAADNRPTLAFDQYLVNLRQTPLRPTLWGDYHFTNVGDTPLTITELKPSCGCLQPQLAADKRTYQPGERGMFRVQVATANEPPGPHAYEVQVKYTAPNPQEAIVRFKLVLPERKVTVEPAELAFFQYNGQPSSRVIHVTDYRPAPLDVLQITTTSPLVTGQVGTAETDEGGHQRIPIELRVPGRVPVGRTVVTVAIHTSDPEFAIIRIPILIDGPPRDIQLIGHEESLLGEEEPAAEEPAASEAPANAPR